jgi:hypothetical protein
VTFPQGTFTPLVHAHAGRTPEAQIGQKVLSLFLQKNAKKPPEHFTV